MANIKDQIKEMLENGSTEEIISEFLQTELKQALYEKDHPVISTIEEEQIQALNDFLLKYCPKVRFTFEEGDLEVVGELINTIVPACEHMVALVIDKSISSIQSPFGDFGTSESGDGIGQLL